MAEEAQNSAGPEGVEWLNRPLISLLLRRMIFSIMAGTAGLALLMFLAGYDRPARLGTVVAGATAFFWFLQKRGHLTAASVAISVSLLSLTAYTMATAQGLNDSAIVLIPGVLLLASVLLGPRGFFLMVVLASLFLSVIAYTEINGILLTKAGTKLGYDSLAEILGLVWIEAAMIYFFVTTLARALKDEKSARESTREVFNATNEAIMVHDARTGAVLDVNESMLRMYECTREDALGAHLEKLSSGEVPYTLKEAQSHIARAISEGPQSFSWRARRLSGELFWAEVSLRYALIAGEPRVLAVVRDVSQRRELERRVQEAERLSAVGLLAGGIAHDFNNQLMGIMGNAEFLRDEAKDEETRECAESILDSSDRAADLTKKLLAFARRGRDRVEVVDIHALVREVVALVERSFDKSIEIEQRLEAEPSSVLGDPSALQNALLNLTLNARDAMPRGGALCFSTSVVQGSESEGRAKGTAIRLCISDTGDGMSSEVSGKIFEPFFTTKEKGSGMGLAAVYGTVQDHEGSIIVQSKLDEGTTFTLLFPVRAGEVQKKLSTKPPIIGTQHGRILVVDDEAVVSQVVKKALNRAGYQVEAFSSGTSVLQSFKAGAFEMALLDITMPEMDGVELLTRLRELQPSLPVLLMSGHASEDLHERLLEFKDVSVLSKPFTIEQLNSAVARARLGAFSE